MEADTARILTSVEALWWLGFFGAFGLCVGSFLNVVIYRLPRGISLREPVWSFCPECHSPIRWYDNLPVLGFLRLRGRCRDCRSPISPRYPLVELFGGLVTLLVFDAFFIADTHAGLAHYIGLTWRVGDDWPIYLAHVILFTSLLAMSAIDIEHYWVDVRFTTFATVAGVVLHAAWTPIRQESWLRPEVATGVGALATLVTLLVTLCLLRRFIPEPVLDTQADLAESAAPEGGAPETPCPEPNPELEPDASHTSTPIGAVPDPGLLEAQPVDTEVRQAAANPPRPDTGEPEALVAGPDVAYEAPDLTGPAELTGAAEPGEPSRPAAVVKRSRIAPKVGALLAGAALLVLAVGAWCDSSEIGPVIPADIRWAPALTLFFLVIVAGGIPRREADVTIVETIELERHSARKTAGVELLCLLPSVLLGGAAIYWGITRPEAADWYSRLLRWEPIAGWRPVTGLATAAMGFVVGGGIGWLVRLVGTFIIGKEALGTGDIHMMAAAGCVAGWPVVLIGFVLCSFLALVGWILILPFKRSRAIPLGPWLSISFLIVVLFHDPIMKSPTIQAVVDLVNLLVFKKPL